MPPKGMLGGHEYLQGLGQEHKWRLTYFMSEFFNIINQDHKLLTKMPTKANETLWGPGKLGFNLKFSDSSGFCAECGNIGAILNLPYGLSSFSSDSSVDTPAFPSILNSLPQTSSPCRLCHQAWSVWAGIPECRTSGARREGKCRLQAGISLDAVDFSSHGEWWSWWNKVHSSGQRPLLLRSQGTLDHVRAQQIPTTDTGSITGLIFPHAHLILVCRSVSLSPTWP